MTSKLCVILAQSHHGSRPCRACGRSTAGHAPSHHTRRPVVTDYAWLRCLSMRFSILIEAAKACPHDITLISHQVRPCPHRVLARRRPHTRVAGTPCTPAPHWLARLRAAVPIWRLWVVLAPMCAEAVVVDPANATKWTMPFFVFTVLRCISRHRIYRCIVCDPHPWARGFGKWLFSDL